MNYSNINGRGYTNRKVQDTLQVEDRSTDTFGLSEVEDGYVVEISTRSISCNKI